MYNVQSVVTAKAVPYGCLAYLFLSEVYKIDIQG